MELKGFIIILIYIYFCIDFSLIINLILFNDKTKNSIASYINMFSRIIDLNEDYNNSYSAYIHELKLFINEVNSKNFSVYFKDSLKEVTFDFKNLSGQIKFKIYELSSEEEVNVPLDIVNLNYTLKIDYSKRVLEYKNVSFKIKYNEEKLIELNKIIGKSDEYIQNTINNSFQNKLEILPITISKTMKDSFDNHSIIFGLVYYYNKLDNIIMQLYEIVYYSLYYLLYFLYAIIREIIQIILRMLRIIN